MTDIGDFEEGCPDCGRDDVIVEVADDGTEYEACSDCGWML